MTNRKSCLGCIHHRPIIGIEKGCNYYFDTGKLRNEPVEDCHHKNTDLKELRRLERKEARGF